MTQRKIQKQTTMFKFTRFAFHQQKIINFPKDVKLSKRFINPADQRKRLAVLIDGDLTSVRTYFTKVEPLIRTINSDTEQNTGNVVLLHRVFFQQSVLKPEWQQVVMNRSDSFESFRVQRFIAMHLQMVADGAHIAQLRLQNRVQGIVWVTDQTSCELYKDQIVNKRKDSFDFVDRYVVFGEGAIDESPSSIGKKQPVVEGWDGFAVKIKLGDE